MKSINRVRATGGQVLIGAVVIMVVLLILIPAMVEWVRQESRISVKNAQSTTAFNLAEAAIDRGMVMLKSSTSTWATAQLGKPISGYEFDQTYTDVPGGTYRVCFASTTFQGSPAELVWGEGRNNLKNETRSLQAIYQNLSVPGGIISGATLSMSGQALPQWGPVLAMNTITLSGAAATVGYPRKLSKQNVISTPVNTFDTTYPNPPNTDGKEWWANYSVPDLPIFDFTAFRSSATNTLYAGLPKTTLNCSGMLNGNGGQVPLSADMVTLHSGPRGLIPCNVACPGGNCFVGNIFQDNRFDDNDVWYWDNNVTMNNPGLNGTVVVRGNLVSNNGDWYGPYGPKNATLNLHVPVNAWVEYQKIDTGSTNQFPADNGLRNTKSSYILGSCGSACEGGSPGSGSDLGFYGFVYVGGNANINGDAEIYGAIWVVGSWTGTGNPIVFYNDQLNLPTLNIVLVRQSWQEVGPNKIPWP